MRFLPRDHEGTWSVDDIVGEYQSVAVHHG
jgi:hypothetical protein